MFDSARLARLLLVGSLLGLGGCMGLPASAPRLGRLRAPRREHPKVPDLRIPKAEEEPKSEFVAQGPDIPVVPIAPPPLYPGKGRAPAPLPPVKPVNSEPEPPKPIPDGLPPIEPLPARHVPPQPRPTPPPRPTTDSGANLPKTVEEMVGRSVAAYARFDSYIVRMTRREEVKGKKQPEELILFKFRKQPWSLHMKWLGKEGQGREVIYVKGQYDNKIHTLLASGDIPFVRAGKRMAFAVDSTLVRSASRHPITEAGLGACLGRCQATLERIARGDRTGGHMKFLGLQARPDFSGEVLVIEHHLPPGLEAPLPRGGRRLIGFDKASLLPVLVQTFDDRANEVEYYRYDRLQAPVGLDGADFDPDRLWGDKKK